MGQKKYISVKTEGHIIWLHNQIMCGYVACDDGIRSSICQGQTIFLLFLILF